MGNSLKTEKEFFSFLRKHFSKEDLIKLDYAFIPNGVSNKLNRYYSNSTSIWFSRLKVKDSQKIYYFGSMEDEKLGERTKVIPRVIFYFDEKITKSAIRFYNGNFLVLIETSKFGEAYEKLKNNSLKLLHGSKDKNAEKYYVDLGELNSNKLIKNLDFFIKSFNFEINLNNIIISLVSVLNENNNEDVKSSKPNQFSEYYLNNFKFNLKAIEIKNNVKKTKLSYSDGKKLMDHIFNENIDGDFYFNDNLKNRFNKTNEELLTDLNNLIINFKNESDYNVFFRKIVNAIKENSEKSSSSNVDKGLDREKSISVNATIDDVIDENDLILDSLITMNGIFVSEAGVDVPEEESEFTTDLNLELINKILLKLNIDSSLFNLNGNVIDEELKTKSISDLKDFASNMMFRFNTKTLNDEERECIVKKIEIDISENRIYGEIRSIVNYYVNQYKLAKNKFFALKYLKFYINSDSFNKFILEYDENTVNSIINRIKDDIEKNNLEYPDIETKFEIYFRSFESNKKYYDELESYRKDIKIYAYRYNLTNEELTLLFDNIECKINDNNGSMNISFLIEKDIENLVLDIKSDTCDYVNNLSLDELTENLKLSEDGCEKLKRKTRDIIYKDNLRIFEITMEYLFNLRNEMINNGIINQNEILR